MVILTLLHPQERTPLKQWRFAHDSLIRIGRAPDNHVVLDNPLVSRRHLELQVVVSQPGGATSGNWQMVNYSSNGTFLNGILVARGLVPNSALLQLAQGGPILQVQILSYPNLKQVSPSPQLPTIARSQNSNHSGRSPICSHLGNAPNNLFCIHCGQPIRVEKQIRQYQVLRVLGKGGMGTTYLVWKPSQQTSSARLNQELQVLKEMNDDMAHIPKAQELFEREASVLKTLNHPGIPRFYDFFIEQGKKYLVMELIHGQNLEKWVHQSGPVSWQQAVIWMLQTCEVVNYLHHQPIPIIHRDIKPGNLLVQNLTKRIVVLDFGAVKAVGAQSGTRIGAEGYSAPEQIQGRPVTQSDLYAVGVCLIFLITGESPHRFYNKEHHGPRFVLNSVSAIPPNLRKVIERTTELKPMHRYRTAQELAQAFKTCLES